MKKLLLIVFLAYSVVFSIHAEADSYTTLGSATFGDLSVDNAMQVMDLPPEIQVAASLSTAMNSTLNFCPTISDPNAMDILTVSTCDMPSAANGIVTVNLANCISYEPNPNFAGIDSFCLQVCDQTGLCDSVVSVVCVEPNPLIVGDMSVCPGETVTYTTSTFNPDNSYSWSVNQNALIQSISDNTIEITFNENPGGTSELTLIEEAGGTCQAIAFANIVIEENLPLSCNGGVNVSLTNECIAEITPDMVLEGQQYPDESYTVILLDEDGTQLPSTVVDASLINQTLEVQVIHDCSGNFCWGFVTIEDKIAPVLECPEDQILTCAEFSNFVPIQPAIVGTACGLETFDFTVNEVEGTCDSTFAFYLTYTYIATDQSGNESQPCSYNVFVEKQDLADLTFPVNYDGLAGNEDPLSCSGNFAVDDNGNPSPSVTGQPGGFNGLCANLGYTYTDTRIATCEESGCVSVLSSYKVVREWVAVEWCTGEIVHHTQIIKVLDTTDPVIGTIQDVTISTDIWGCSATLDLPVISVSDNCTDQESISISYSSELGTQVGSTIVFADPAVTAIGEPIVVEVLASDCCGNEAISTFNVTITDNIPPTVIGETHRSVSLTINGTAKIFAEDFDDGSHDGCGPIAFFVKRMDNGSGCQNFDEFPPSGNDNAQFNQAVFFCCNDIGSEPVMVQFQVCDDGNQDGLVGNIGDNCNLAMVEVTVQDKIMPIIQCPADMVVNCSDIIGVDLTNESELDNLFGTAQAAGTCNVNVAVQSNSNENCGEGVIVRNFTATTTGGTATCTQFITITPGPQGLLTCDRISFADLNNNIYNWCAVNDNINNNNDDLPAITIDCDSGLVIPELDINLAGLCTEAGVDVDVDTFNFAGGACKKFVIHYEVIDQCIFDENYVDPSSGELDPFNSGNGYFEFYLEINAFDNTAPTPDCDDVTLEAESCDGFTGSYELPITDNCTSPEFISRLYRVDAFNDGNIDFPATGYAIGNFEASDLGLSAIPIGTHKVYWLLDDGCGNETTCSQSITIAPGDKKPTPYCYNGLSVAVMPSTGTVDLWAADFDAGSFGNCESPLTFTMLPVVDASGLSNEEAYAQSLSHPNVTIQTNGEYGFTFDCSYIPNGVTSVNEIYIFVTDQNGAWDFCTSTLRIDDNFDACDDNSTGMLVINGDILTKKGQPIKNVEMKLDANYPEFPFNDVTTTSGAYEFDNLFGNIDYTLIPTKDDNHLQAITTLDILYIQRHVLGIEELNSPYDMIAADVNNDCKINGLDIIQIRKLLLGKYNNDKFPMNTSWRFVHEDIVFNSDAELCDFEEALSLQNLEASTTEDFIGLKVGDVNASVDPEFSGSTEERNIDVLELIVDNVKLAESQKVAVPVRSSNFEDVYGFQFELDLSGAIYHTIEANAIDLTSSNVHMESNLLKISYSNTSGSSFDEDEILFTIYLEAKQAAELGDILQLKQDKLLAEAYIGRNFEIFQPALVFRENTLVAGEYKFSLSQNEPNPFKSVTNIMFTLPTSGEAEIIVYDVAGKVLKRIVNIYPQGINVVTLDRNDLGSSGVLFYKLEAGDFSASRKMIILD